MLDGYASGTDCKGITPTQRLPQAGGAYMPRLCISWCVCSARLFDGGIGDFLLWIISWPVVVPIGVYVGLGTLRPCVA